MKIVQLIVVFSILTGCSSAGLNPTGTWEFFRNDQSIGFVRISEKKMEIFSRNSWDCDVFLVPSGKLIRLQNGNEQWLYADDKDSTQLSRLIPVHDDQFVLTSGTDSLLLKRTDQILTLSEETYTRLQERARIHDQIAIEIALDSTIKISTDLKTLLAQIDSMRSEMLKTINIDFYEVECWADIEEINSRDIPKTFFESKSGKANDSNFIIIRTSIIDFLKSKELTHRADQSIYLQELLENKLDFTNVTLGEFLISINQIKKELIIIEQKN